jgi:nitrogen fixation protein NifZ
MSDSAQPKFQWGQPVWSMTDLFNDGSYPDAPPDALLVRGGDRGEVVQVGAHVETNTTIYLVEFGVNCVVGCLEDEIESIPPPQVVASNESPIR